MLTVVIFVLPFGIIKNNNSQLFRLLIKRQIPAVILRMLYNMYVSHVTCVDWNGVRSSVFSVINGVTQGGMISPILFCIYIDDLLSGLANLGAGCYIGDCYIGALAYADDIVLIAPSANSMRKMLRFCEHYALEYNIMFNSDNSKCIFVPNKGVQDAFKHKGMSFTLITLLLNTLSSGPILVMSFQVIWIINTTLTEVVLL